MKCIKIAQSSAFCEVVSRPLLVFVSFYFRLLFLSVFLRYTASDHLCYLQTCLVVPIELAIYDIYKCIATI